MKVENFRVPIIWLGDIVRLGKHGKRHISLGYCGKTKKVAFIAAIKPDAPITEEFLKTLIVKDVYVDKECGDAEFCWNLKCRLNKASLKHLGKYVGKKGTMEDIKKTAKNIQEIGNRFVDQIEDWSKPVNVFYEKPLAILSLQRKHKK